MATLYDPGVDFAALSSFAVVDTVSFIGTQPEAGLDPSISQAIISQVTAAWSSRGYAQVSRSEHPDLGINISLETRDVVQAAIGPSAFWTNSAYLGVPAYWGYPGAGLYAPWSYVTGAWQNGTLSIEALDLARGQVVPPSGAGTPGTATQNLGQAWAAYIHGAVSDTPQPNSPALVQAIEQAFTQSPYLQHH